MKDGMRQFLARWWPLSIPFVIALLAVLMPMFMVLAVQPGDGTHLEGALFMMAILGYAAALVTFPWAVIAAAVIERRDPRGFAEFVSVLAIATLPTAWLQCVNVQTSLMPFFWGWWHQVPDRGWTDIIVSNSAAYIVFFLVVAYLSYRGATPRKLIL